MADKKKIIDDNNDIHVPKDHEPILHEDEKPKDAGESDGNLSNYFVVDHEKGEGFSETPSAADAKDIMLNSKANPATENEVTTNSVNESPIKGDQPQNSSLNSSIAASQSLQSNANSSGRSTQELDLPKSSVVESVSTENGALNVDAASNSQSGDNDFSEVTDPKQAVIAKQKSAQDETSDGADNDESRGIKEEAPEIDLSEPPIEIENTVPTSADTSIQVNEDTPYSFAVAEFKYQDEDGDEIDHITIKELPANGSLTLDGKVLSAGDEVSADDISKLSFMPGDNESGESYGNFIYTVSDGENESTPQEFIVDVTGIADTPSLSVQNSGGTPINIRISGDHYDPKNGDDVGAGSPKFQVFVNGELLVIDGQKTFTVEAERGDWENFRVEVPSSIDIDSVDVKFVNDAWEGRGDKDGDGVAGEDRNLIVDKLNIGGEANSDGSYSGGVTIEAEDAHYDKPDSDGYEVMPWSGTLSFDTSAIELGPQATGAEDTAIALNIKSELSDSSETLSIQISEVPEGAELSAGESNGDGSWSLAPDDLDGLMITPPENFSGNFDLTVTAQSTDGSDSASVSETLNVAVSEINDGPNAADDKAGGEEDTTISGNVLKNDSDVEGKIQVENTGTFDTEHGSITVKADGSYEYSPDENYNGSDSFEVTIVDDDGATSTSTLELSVSDVNDGPVAADDKAGGEEDTTISGNVLKNDSDVDGKIQVENTGTFDTEHGSITVKADGSYEYSPDENYNGSDSFEVTIVDDDGATSTSTLNITINDDNVINVIEGDDSNNVLRGTSENDQIIGNGGNDYLNGGASNDQLSGGDGNDTLIGGEGSDSLSGGAGNDTLYVDAKDTKIDGGEGTDSVRVQGEDGVKVDMTESSIERAYGGDGDDTFDASGSSENVYEYGYGGDDTLTGGDGNDYLNGGDGNDQLSGGDGADRLIGGEGNDVLNGGAGNDALYGGDGSDHLEFMANMGNDKADGGAGGGWMDTVELNGFESSAGPGDGWTLSLDKGSTIESSEMDGELLLSGDASGTITFDDGGSLDFDNMEKIVW